MKHTISFFVFFVATLAIAAEKIDRRAVVERHNIESGDLLLQLPLGNGNFCVTVDGTGLQTFGGNVMSHDAWHRSPLPDGFTMKDVPETGSFQQGRCRPGQGDKALPQGFEPLRQWMFDNPHIANLARIRLMRPGGVEIKPDEIKKLKRKLSLWNGIHKSTFEIDDKEVIVIACVAPNGLLGVLVNSELLGNDLEVVLDFPYPTEQNGAWVGKFDLSERHETTVVEKEEAHRRQNSLQLLRKADSLEYPVEIHWNGGDLSSQDTAKHIFRFGKKNDSLAMTISFPSENSKPKESAELISVLDRSQKQWCDFWQSGGAIDLSGSTDPRSRELERRIVLSQYLMRCNTAGTWCSAECGLLATDPWRGQFHMEMVWWHLAHCALWDRLECSDEALRCYDKFKPIAKKLAEQLGYKGYKWGKSVGPEGRTAPWVGNQVLLWKQQHPMFFAELEYRNRPTPQTLEKWADILDGTAENMVDYAVKDEHGVFHLDPVMPPSEVGISKDTVFDLAYWRFGLDIANRWRERMGKPRNENWDNVRKNLAQLPTVDDPKDGRIYARSVDWLDEFTKRNWEHPDMAGVFGMLPAMDGVDPAISKRTIEKMKREWTWSKCWGWDFPWIAMSFVRNGDPDGAIDMLLHDSPRNQDDERGVNLGGPCPYLPGNGGLLYVAAMMCAGWDGAPDGDVPGFPQDGKWKVRWENLKVAP